MSLNPGDHLEALAADSEAFTKAAEGNLDRQVQACPEWKVADLVAHLGAVYSYVIDNVEAGVQKPDTQRAQPPSDRAQLVEWFATWRGRVVDTLSSRDPDDPAWSFVGPVTVGWWRRRQALETAVHLWDLETAAGNAATIGPELAADGIDEFLSVLLPAVLGWKPIPALTGTFHVHATDTPGEWQLDFAAPGLDVRREHGKAATALRGPAAGLYLWLWNRVTTGDAALEVFGDGRPVENWSKVRL